MYVLYVLYIHDLSFSSRRWHDSLRRAWDKSVELYCRPPLDPFHAKVAENQQKLSSPEASQAARGWLVQDCKEFRETPGVLWPGLIWHLPAVWVARNCLIWDVSFLPGETPDLLHMLQKKSRDLPQTMTSKKNSSPKFRINKVWVEAVWQLSHALCQMLPVLQKHGVARSLGKINTSGCLFSTVAGVLVLYGVGCVCPFTWTFLWLPFFLLICWRISLWCGCRSELLCARAVKRTTGSVILCLQEKNALGCWSVGIYVYGCMGGWMSRWLPLWSDESWEASW